MIAGMRHLFMLVLAVAPLLRAQERAVQPVPRAQVTFDSGFWADRLATNRKVTLPHCFDLCESTHRLANFAIAGGLAKGKHEGFFFNDSDVFKIVEGACYAYQATKDAALRARIDDVVTKIAAAQEPDGYLYTARTLQRDDHMPPGGKERWSDLGSGHELYCAGHLYEAGVAHFEATGTRTLLDVAVKHASLVAKVFGPGKNEHPDGHPEVELALVKLACASGKPEFLELAKFFVEARGRRGGGRGLYGEYAQDHLPLRAQTEPVGHAVRAAYLYCGAADIAAATGDTELEGVVARLWRGILEGKVYLTGGIGSRSGGEAFGAPFELPNERAYAETCAAIANALLGWRMFLASGSGDDFDVVERSLYNGTLAGLALSGNRFFYPNPLASRRGAERSPWFDCACCPSNVVRIVESVPGFAYATRANELLVCLYQSSATEVVVAGMPVQVRQRTEYPWRGSVALTLAPKEATRFTLALRIPGFARGVALQGGLYRFAGAEPGKVVLRVAGEEVPVVVQDGFARIEREWKPGDTVTLDLPLAPRRVLARDEVDATRGRVAIQYGPLVYCAEACDQKDDKVQSLVLPEDAKLASEWHADLLGGVVTVRGAARTTERKSDETVALAGDREVMLVPYFTWANRKRGPMAVWLPRDVAVAEPPPAPSLALGAKLTTTGGADPRAMVDQLLPKRSNDHDVPFFHWWPKKGDRKSVV